MCIGQAQRSQWKKAALLPIDRPGPKGQEAEEVPMKFLHKILLLFFFCFRKLGSSHFVTNKPAQQTINKRCICWLQCPSEINKDLYDLTQQLSIRQIVCTQKHKEFPRNFWQKKPSVGRAEKLKPHEAIPPLSLIEVSIHGKKADTLEKTV